jgi:hypothetical protein
MTSPEFDFWYALNNTEVVLPPSGRLETFGNTVVNYYLLAEQMDDTNEIRIREGRVEAYRPQIITPSNLEQASLEGFGSEAGQYMDWLKQHLEDLVILKYGFMVKKEESREFTVHDTLPVVVDRVRTEVKQKNDPLSAVLVGVESPWEVCLMKLMVDIMQKSVMANVADMQKKNLLPMDPAQSERLKRLEIEDDFKKAARDASLTKPLGQKLLKYGMFNEYEDRYFALIRSR